MAFLTKIWRFIFEKTLTFLRVRKVTQPIYFLLKSHFILNYIFYFFKTDSLCGNSWSSILYLMLKDEDRWQM